MHLITVAFLIKCTNFEVAEDPSDKVMKTFYRYPHNWYYSISTHWSLNISTSCMQKYQKGSLFVIYLYI